MLYEVIPIPAFNDNYIWLIKTSQNPQAVIVDPGDATPVIHYLETYQLELAAILLTHHHADHSGGIAQLIEYKNTPVWGPSHEKVRHATYPVIEGELVVVPELEFQLRVLAMPGHTLGHIAFYGQGMLFCGDTLFAGGCGRVFEGTPLQLYQSLQTLAALPPETKIYCGHEYTQANLAFARAVEPNNEILHERFQQVCVQRSHAECTLPSTIELELQTNPFLRCHLPRVQEAVIQHCGRHLTEPAEVFAELRAWKNEFKQ